MHVIGMFSDFAFLPISKRIEVQWSRANFNNFSSYFLQMYYVNQELTVEDFLYDDDYKIDLSGSNLDVLNNLEGIVQLEYPQFNLPQELAIPWHEYMWTECWGYFLAHDRFAHNSDFCTFCIPEAKMRCLGLPQACYWIRKLA